ncbi:hypothetical protein GCM10023185_34690 [Hymenobacter saemangeumensis]|uniref:Zinc-ribbon domain-containing protein n=1 Tax=Hymenobacter saemangeumensis TaxID=1084522 RepID=A0ABP8IP13_9BACT
MIFYGTNGSLVRTEALPGYSCPSCATADTLQLSVFSRYVHIYWIPVLPYSRPLVASCTHCAQAWEGQGLPAELREPAQLLKKTTRHPYAHWAGLALIFLLISGGAVASKLDDRADKALLAAPKAGDIYTVRTKDNNYSLLKVVSAGGTAVELVANEYEIDNNSPLDELNSPDKYSKESFSLTRFDLQIMREKDEITEIDRPGE